MARRQTRGDSDYVTEGLPSMRIDGLENDRRARLKRAELASGLGAGVLGTALGVRFAPYLSGLWLLLLAVGAVLHAGGMWRKHRLEASAGNEPVWWEALLYGLCWVLLGVVAVYAALRAIS